MRRLAVVGGGIVGLAVARQLLLADPKSSVVLIEREDAVGTHQSGHNSGVIHSGLYYSPGSLKAELCVSGGKLLRSYCSAHAIPIEVCGKVVVAVEDSELPRLQALFERGVENGVPGLRLVEAPDLRELEPHVTGLRAIHSPTTSVVDFTAVTRALATEIASSGELWLGTEVISVVSQGGGLVRLELAGRHGGRLDCDFAIVCAGLQSDRVAVRSGGDAEPRIVPFRGSYYRLRQASRHLVRGLVYPVPDPKYPFLGIHLTRTVHGDVLVGPNAFLGLSRDNYARWAFDWQDVRETLTWPGFVRFAGANWRAGARELSHAMSRRGFASAVSRYVPELTAGDLEPAVAGIRAQAMLRDGSLVDDFWLETRNGVLDVRNAPSPAATASFAIADHICRTAGLS
ncbi:MAG: L-2-hydroxyglutarate oxidase [Acidimicrobiales bacterium]|jgi:L-2-hydroxyglutarate oxidase LhgO